MKCDSEKRQYVSKIVAPHRPLARSSFINRRTIMMWIVHILVLIHTIQKFGGGKSFR